MRRLVISIIAALVSVVAVSGAVMAGTSGGSSVTQPRLERALADQFANLYTDEARLLGHQGVTPASLHPKAMCDKGGAVEADIGPGSNWNCLMSWTDPNVPMPPEGYGKFEVTAHTNGCYTAGGPSKLVGFQTITDTHGRQVTNPVYEFDGCFDPNADNTPTGHSFPSLLTSTTTALLPDGQRHVALQLSCGTGNTGCRGTITATSGSASLGTVPFQLREEQSRRIPFPRPVPAGAKDVTFTFRTTTGVGPSSPSTLDMPAS
jgi:hypothetical protein